MKLNIQENVPLAPYTTFHIGGPARYFFCAKNEHDIVLAVEEAKRLEVPVFPLGGGSNVLISDDGYKGLIIKMENRGVKYEDDGDKSVITVAAGEMWDEFVQNAVERGLYGIENLSAIPGTVGATPVQNIGAYGSDICNSIVKVRVYDRRDESFKYLSREQCDFGYRDSVFKKEKGRYIITEVVLELSKKGKVNTSYMELQRYFDKNKGPGYKPTLKEVRDAVINIRWGKLPDWKKWGTAGSFFMNPKIEKTKYEELKAKYPGLPGFPEPDGRVKVSLGWILDKVCDLKGFGEGNVKTYDKQALVIVTTPGATAEEVVKLSQKIMNAVKEKIGIDIKGEVEWVN